MIHDASLSLQQRRVQNEPVMATQKIVFDLIAVIIHEQARISALLIYYFMSLCDQTLVN